LLKTAPFACQGEMQFITADAGGLTVQRRRQEDSAIVDEAVCPHAPCGCTIEEIAASPSGRWVVTQRYSGQGEWGYDVIRSCPLAYEAGTPDEGGIMLDIPRFSEDESRLAGGFGDWWLGGWWSHQDFEPASGGLISFGFLFVHRLPSHRVERHELQMDLPRGWIPDDPEAELWMGAREIEPVGEGVRLILPGGVPFEHRGPLPPVLLLPSPHPAGLRLL
jgi:hypothetical protein